MRQKVDPEMTKMLLTLDDRVYKKKTTKILLWLTSLRVLQKKQTDDGIFSKKVTRWLFDNCCIVPNEKIRRSFLKYFLILKSSIYIFFN